jgi:hypothetical protein
MTRRLGVLAIALSLLGCSAHASISASAGGAKTAAAEPLQPRVSAWERENREEAEVATRAGTPVPQTEVAATDGASANETAAVAPPAKARRGKKAAHGRGKSKKHQDQGAEIAAANEEQPDHDRGHGNDLDGVDEDNPGKSKRKK